MSERTLVDVATRQIVFARQYVVPLIDSVPLGDWFRMPADEVTHLAWQVGHLAMAQYGLTMLRIRGKEPSDADLISNDFVRLFQKRSRPGADARDYPAPIEIRSVFDRVYTQAIKELAGQTDEALQVTLPEPHAVFDTKLGSLFFCSAHEMLHAGQIGLLRRLLGFDPLR